MAPVALTAAGGPSMRVGSQAVLRAPFRPQRPCRAPGRRQELVLRAAEADRSKDQDTVGDLTKDQVQAALGRQVQRSQGKAGAEGGGSNGQGAVSGQTVDISDADAGAQQQEAPATGAEREESLRALQELKGRVPLMSQDDVQQAIDRLLRQGDSAEESSTSSRSKGSGSDGPSGDSSSNSGSTSSQAAAPAKPTKPSGGGAKASSGGKKPSGGGKKGKYGADQTYEDGSLLFTADSLSKISFDELKP